jgi:predicted oxidoreductase
MKTYRWRGANMEVSRIAYGCMKIGGRWDSGPITDAEKQAGIAAVLAAYDAGVTFFDHADIYARGKSEAVFGEVLKANPGLREKIVIQTKCGIRFANDPQPGDPTRYDFSYEHIMRSVEGSLRRLQVEYLDILLLHRPDALVEPEEVARAFDDLANSGKVNHFGVSNHTAFQIQLLQKSVRQQIEVNQLQLSLVHHDMISEGVIANTVREHTAHVFGLLDYCRLHDIIIQAWSPVAGGRLFRPEAEDDERLRPAARLVKQMAQDKGVSAEAIMVAWLLRHPAGIQPIIGSLKPERIGAALEADGVALSREEWYALLAAARGESVP